MASSFTMKLDTKGWSDAQRKMLAEVKDASAPLTNWALEEAREIAAEWNKMTAGSLANSGKLFRDEIPWKKLAKGAIGRKRPSGQRMTPGSVVGKDTGDMVRDFTGDPVLSPDHRSISLIAQGGYRTYQNRLRRYNKATRKSRASFKGHVTRWLNAMITRMKQRAAQGRFTRGI